MPVEMKSAAAGSDPRSSGERDKALNLVLGQIERNFGKGSIMRLGDASRMRVETISTGALTLDLAPVSYTHLTLPTSGGVLLGGGAGG